MLNDDALARKISAYLGHQPAVPARIAYQLSEARRRALMQVDAPRRTWSRLLEWPALRIGVAIASLTLGLAYFTWRVDSPTDAAELDIELLTAELPPAAYLDPGFARVLWREQGNK